MKKITAEELAELIKKLPKKKIMDFAVLFDEINGVIKKHGENETLFDFAYVFENCAPENFEFCFVYGEIEGDMYISVLVEEANYEKFEAWFSGSLKSVAEESMVGSIIFTSYCDFIAEKTGEGDILQGYFYESKEKVGVIEDIPDVIIRPLLPSDENFSEKFTSDVDDYLKTIFGYTIKEPVYDYCGILGVFARGDFAGYLAYYGIDDFICDVSYVYISNKYRSNGLAMLLLRDFTNQCLKEGKIPFYSNADGEDSIKLIKKFNYVECAKRMQTEIEIM